MRRPRHREKSNLLWKMVGVAGAINLVLWPILVHEGVFSGIKHETLIPVRLVSMTPPSKLPDALQKVPRTPLVVSVPSTTIAAKPAKSPQKRAVTLTANTETAAPTVSVRVASADIPQPHSPLTSPQPRSSLPPAVARSLSPPSHAVKPEGKRLPVGTPAPTPAQNHVRVLTRAERAAVAARLARARQQEAQGHLVAEEIARRRASQAAASLPQPPAPPDSPAPTRVADAPIGAEGMVTHPDSVSVVTPAPPKTAPKKTAASPAFVPAVPLTKAYPAVPDRLMTRTWHATFVGRMIVRGNGTVTAQTVTSTGIPALDRRALDAARRWRFRPARRNGKAVSSSQPVAFEFDVHPVH